MTPHEPATETLAEARTLVLVASSVLSKASDLVGSLEIPEAEALAEALGSCEDDLYGSYGMLGGALRRLQAGIDETTREETHGR